MRVNRIHGVRQFAGDARHPLIAGGERLGVQRQAAPCAPEHKSRQTLMRSGEGDEPAADGANGGGNGAVAGGDVGDGAIDGGVDVWERVEIDGIAAAAGASSGFGAGAVPFV